MNKLAILFNAPFTPILLALELFLDIAADLTLLGNDLGYPSSSNAKETDPVDGVKLRACCKGTYS
jgi:hypothetical protein